MWFHTGKNTCFKPGGLFTKATQLSSTNLFLLVNTPNVSMISGINNNNFTPNKEPKRNYNPPLRYKISQFFQNIQPFLVATLCIGKPNF